MTPKFKLLVNEKAVLVSRNNFFVLELVNKQEDITKIGLKTLIKKIGLNALKINSLQPKSKFKRRGKKQNIVEMKKAKKYFVQLKTGQQLNEEAINKLNELK